MDTPVPDLPAAKFAALLAFISWLTFFRFFFGQVVDAFAGRPLPAIARRFGIVASFLCDVVAGRKEGPRIRQFSRIPFRVGLGPDDLSSRGILERPAKLASRYFAADYPPGQLTHPEPGTPRGRAADPGPCLLVDATRCGESQNIFARDPGWRRVDVAGRRTSESPGRAPLSPGLHQKDLDLFDHDGYHPATEGGVQRKDDPLSWLWTRHRAGHLAVLGSLGFIATHNDSASRHRLGPRIELGPRRGRQEIGSTPGSEIRPGSDCSQLAGWRGGKTDRSRAYVWATQPEPRNRSSAGKAKISSKSC